MKDLEAIETADSAGLFGGTEVAGNPAGSPGPGSLYVVATPIGNLSDVSPRALEVLRSVKLILAEDTRHSKRLLQHYGITAPTLSFHKFNERSRAGEVIRRILDEGIDVAIISDAGTPCISDPGAEIVRLAREQGVSVFGVSGPSAIATAVSVSGLPAREFTFLGFLPRGAGELREALHSMKERRLSTFVVYESPRRIQALAGALREEFPEALACFCCELTKVHERSYYGPVSEVVERLESDPMADRGEYTVVVHVEPAPVEARAAVDGLSPEALLVDAMVRRGLSPKEAVAAVAAQGRVPRKELYQAGLRLKTLLSGGLPKEAK